MGSLKELQGNIEAIHKNLEQGKAFLLGRTAAYNQYADMIRSGLEGTSSPEYNQMLSLLHMATEVTNKSAVTLSGVEEMLEKWAQEHIGISLGGINSQGSQSILNEEPNSAEEKTLSTAHPTKLTPSEVNERWKSVVETTDEIVNNYRDALIGRGIPAGKMLEKFLAAEKAKMLNYESAVLDEASGHGNVSDQDKYIYRSAGASGEYGYDSLSKEYGKFCLDDASKWIKDINPNYNSPYILPKNNPYRVNCGSCAFAVDTRLSGGDDLVASMTNIGTDFAMEVATGKRCIYMPVQGIEDYLRDQGPGSHVIVGINRGPTPDGTPQAGHWFNAFFDGENFHTIDGQSGDFLEWPYDYGDVTKWCALI